MTSGLRERKKAATRDALHRAALELVADRGLDGVSVDDVAARAGVSPRTFFNYFPSKDDAVLGLDPAAPARLAAAFTARPAAESPLQAMRAVQREQALEMAADPDVWPLRLRVVEASAVLVGRLSAGFAAAERAMAAAIAERTGTEASTDLYPGLLAATSSAVMRTALHRWFCGGFREPLTDLVDEAWDVLAGGLPAPPR
ncbi:TetR/AcrR family transcriptional regulator [Geodermatophilus sp. SYSU D00758]